MLMLFYLIIIARALATGRTAGCNCFGSNSAAPVSRYTLIRNIALTVAAATVAESLTSHLTRSLDEHDRFGAPPTWRFLPPHILSEHLDPGDGQRWYSVNRDERLRRGLALQAMMLVLPGSLYSHVRLLLSLRITV